MATSRTIRRPTTSPTPSTVVNRSVAKIIATIVVNIVFFVVLFQVYKLVRKSFIQRGESIGFVHAEQLIDFQRRLGIFFEPDLQAWMLQHEGIIRALNWYYAGFMWTFYLCCALAIAFAPVRYRFLRRVFISSMLLALPWYAIYPLAPPRFMTEYGFVDTLKLFGPNYFSNEGVVAANQFAAMPSMHIGWSTIGAFMLAAAIPYRKIGPMLAVAHVALMSLTVMATGNHFVLDIIGGWLIVAGSFGAARLLPARIQLPWRRPTPTDLNTQEPVPAGNAPRPALR